MADSCKSDIPENVDLLYPDLMSKDGLLYILKQRYIEQQHVNIENLSKEDLVDLYNRYILPLPQRKYRSNRRGKEMCKKQTILSKKRHLQLNDIADQPTQKKMHQDLDPNHKYSGERLKPPPSSAANGRTVIKLGSSRNDFHLPESEFQNKCDINCRDKKQDVNLRKRFLDKNFSSVDQTSESPSPDKKRINKISWP
ncbi:hypothetical protein Btru_001030 [Bulinus truncatus]|nr:hypothetical protein Btru_001030 [Bulinus truncatus]